MKEHAPIEAVLGNEGSRHSLTVPSPFGFAGRDEADVSGCIVGFICENLPSNT